MKFSSRAAARTRSAVSARTGCGTGPGDSTRETVAMDTPAARATSAIVATSAHANSAAENAARALRQARLFEGLAVLLARGNLAEWLALLLAAAYRLAWIAEGHDRQHVELGGCAEELRNAVQPTETSPVRADAVVPGGEHHRVDRPAGVRHARCPRLLVAHGDGELRVGDVGTGLDQPAELAQPVTIAHHHEMPGLAVVGAGRETAGVDNAADKLVRYGSVLVAPHGEQGADRVENIHQPITLPRLSQARDGRPAGRGKRFPVSACRGRVGV